MTQAEATATTKGHADRADLPAESGPVEIPPESLPPEDVVT